MMQMLGIFGVIWLCWYWFACKRNIRETNNIWELGFGLFGYAILWVVVILLAIGKLHA